MVPTFWIWVRKIRRYGRQSREYVMNMREMCQCHGACFLDVGWKLRGYGKQLREYLVNMRKCASVMVPTFWIWVRKLRRYGRRLREYVMNIRSAQQWMQVSTPTQDVAGGFLLMDIVSDASPPGL